LADAQTLFTLHLVYRRTQRWLDLDGDARAGVAAEVAAILEGHPDLRVRGVYSSVGLRPDADVVFWLIAESPERLQQAAVELRRARFGAASELTWSFLGMAHRPEFVGDHLAAFQQGRPPLPWLCLYPFVRTPEWYLLPAAERGRILREHGQMGMEFPEVQTNNVQAFGIGDYEWILAFEVERLESLVRMVRRLREAEARRHTKLDVPFILGRRKPVEAALSDVG
jgi:peroxiredoxin